MNDLLEFLTSQEIIIVYMIAALACLICFIVYLVEKNNEKLRLRHNTRELNKLVEEIKAMTDEEERALYDEPVLEIQEEKQESSINELLPAEPIVLEPIEVKENPVEEPVMVSTETIEEEPIEELEYTSIEPNPEEAREELRRLQEEFERQEQLEKEQEAKNQYEEEQEKTAIISLEELLSKGQQMYEANELTQYEDEGNEPISLHDLEEQAQRQATVYTEPFRLTSVVNENEVKQEIENSFMQVEMEESMHMDDFETITEETVQPVKQEPVIKKFQLSPIISPIFGIEKDPARENAIALENTANYEKLDAELQKNNEFIMTLQELQEK